VSIDYSALLGSTPGIRVAKGDYDFARDGGDVGDIPMNSPAIPIDSVSVAYILLVTSDILQAAGGHASVLMGDSNSPDCHGQTAGYGSTTWDNEPKAPLTAARAMFLRIEGEPITGGALTYWILYFAA
jgi:hypothetical protein